MALGLLALALTSSLSPTELRIGSYYASAPTGIAFIDGKDSAFLVRIGWVADGAYEDDYGTIIGKNRLAKYGACAPDGSYSAIHLNINGAQVLLEWGRTGASGVVGRVSADKQVRVTLHASPSWPNMPATYRTTEQGIEGTSSGRHFEVRTAGAPVLNVGAAKPEDLAAAVAAWASKGEGAQAHAALGFELQPGMPLLFSAGIEHAPDPKAAAGALDKAKRAYDARRARAEGDWGDFITAITDNMGQSRTYSPDNDRVAHTVSRGWCGVDGQVLFCWDSFFNGLLASVEDPKAGQDTVRAVLAGMTKAGFVANFSGRSWGTSEDRSQPPVGALCVWKMHQRHPDKAFLKEVYPKLVRWHDWWFEPRKENGLPMRDGNRDGLLEWGSEKEGTQGGRFESGLDDSPMFDDVEFSEDSKTMKMDSVDLSSLWAMDAEYLGKIAAELGLKEDAKKFQAQRDEMAKRINEQLWNEELGMYCNRYWEPRAKLMKLGPEVFLGGFQGEYFGDMDLKQPVGTRRDTAIDFDWTDGTPGFGLVGDDYSVRWTSTFRPPYSGKYVFEAVADDGVRLWVNGKLMIDAWKVQAPTTYKSATVSLNAGHEVPVKVEYFQKSGGATMRLRPYVQPDDAPKQVFATSLTPCCFYPMAAGIPDKARADRMIQVLLDPQKFWGKYVVPTVSRDDPTFPQQHYWRGKIWAPTNYLLYQGLRRYASDDIRTEYAKRGLDLFMSNWLKDGTCHENFMSEGEGSSDPHYTWGALLCLIALEEICDVEPDGHLRLNGALKARIGLHSVMLGGKLYDVVLDGKSAKLMQGKKVVLEAGEEAAPTTAGARVR